MEGRFRDGSTKRSLSSKGGRPGRIPRNSTEPKFAEARSEKSGTATSHYDLDYKEELELNLAFEIFKDILD